MTGHDLVPLTPAALPQITSLAEAAADYADGAMAANTRRAYESDFADFASWCASVDAVPLPAAAALIALYLTARAPTHAVSTLARRLAAINAAHDREGLPRPRGAVLTDTWTGIRRKHGRPPLKKRGLLTDDLVKVARKLPDTLAGKRDRAVLALGFAAALRRSELAVLSLDAVAPVRAVFVANGLEIHIAKSKGDQLGKGAVVAVPFGKRLCPVGALRDWLAAAGIRNGPVWRSIDRHGRMSETPIGGKAVAGIVKRAVAGTSLNPDDFAGHSLRRGLITSAAHGGASPEVLMRHARHARFDTTREYIEEADRFRNNAARGAKL